MCINFYEKASQYVMKSWEYWEKNQIGKSWAWTIPARFAYLCETIINLVILPFAITAITFGSLHALCTLNRKSKVYQTSYAFISKTSNHLFLSLFGATVSPALTHKYRDANITPFIIAARVAVVTAGFLYAFLKK